MSLILVVEPDSRHAAQLASIARNHLHAELVMADSGDRAVAALDHRVPDIVLTAPLLPHHDEAVLSDYLRALGEAGAHVQTLTIPILSTPAAAKGGVRARFRKERATPAMPDGCDPALFAEQVGQYLHRARQRRVTATAAPPAPAIAFRETPTEELLAGQVVSDREAEDVDLTPFLQNISEPADHYELQTEPSDRRDASGRFDQDEPIPTRVPAEPPIPTYAPLEPIPTYVPVEPIRRLEPVERVEAVEAIEPTELTEPFEPYKPSEPIQSPDLFVEPVQTVAPVARVAPIAALEPVERFATPASVEPAARVDDVEPVQPAEPLERRQAFEPRREQAIRAVEEVRAKRAERKARHERVEPVLPTEPVLVVEPVPVVEPVLVIDAPPAPVAPLEPRTSYAEAPSRAELLPAVAAPLARRRERRPEPAQVPALVPQPVQVPQVIMVPTGDGSSQTSVSVAVAVSVQVATQTTVSSAPKRGAPGQLKPVQDEWGFFDPDQCGFRALLERLDAIAAKDDED